MSRFPKWSNKQLLLYTLKWTGAYMLIGFIAAFFFPFPFSLVAVVGAFIIINFLITRRALKRMGMNTKQFLDSIRSASANPYGYRPLRYYCMACGNPHREITCPKCGSKMKKVG
ncbi:MAG TPA: hypothetical protein VE130_15920 [Nitrososphaeraceae archaeon]|nr:hypothetical protein [Nitrososphaeraceae archaeon]